MHSKLFIYYENACHVLKDFKLNEKYKIVSHVNVNEFKNEKHFKSHSKTYSCFLFKIRILHYKGTDFNFAFN